MPGGWDGAGSVYNYDGTHTGDNCVSQQTTAEKTAFDTMFTTVTNAIENCVARDGQNSPSANLPMNSKKLTGLTTGSALTDSVNASQLVNSSLIWGGTSTGSANAQAITVSIAPAAYAAGQIFAFKAGYSNTSSTTINVNSLGTKSVVRPSGVALKSGEIIVNYSYVLLYDGTNFILLNPNQLSQTWTPTLTGFSGTPTVEFTYQVVGGFCHFSYYQASVGSVSNASSFGFTLPIASAKDFQALALVADNSNPAVGKVSFSSGSATVQVYSTYAGAGWTSSGAKWMEGCFCYPI